MKCPSCSTEISDQVDACPNCHFTLAILDVRLPPPPLRSGYVNDFAKVLSREEALRIEQRCYEIFMRAQVELVIVTIPTTTPVKPSEYVFWLTNRWDIGGLENRGVMVLLALKERQVESEVG
ncbi:MAG: TPM domain-containing protein, partial [Nitrospira sp.]|nr:TPM domain-containing protein [Nitrospira sp.]